MIKVKTAAQMIELIKDYEKSFAKFNDKYYSNSRNVEFRSDLVDDIKEWLNSKDFIIYFALRELYFHAEDYDIMCHDDNEFIAGFDADIISDLIDEFGYKYI